MSDWTLDTLREHLLALLSELDRRQSQRFEDQDKAVSAALVAAEKAVAAALAAAKEAVQKAELASERRFEGVNEFRATLSDQAATYATRKEIEQRQIASDDKLTVVVARLDRLEGRSSGINAGWLALVGAVSMLATVVTVVVLLAK